MKDLALMMLKGDLASLEHVEGLARTQRDESCHVCRYYFDALVPSSSAGMSAAVFHVLNTCLRMGEVEKWILIRWKDWEPVQRKKIIECAWDASCISTDVAWQLFDQCDSVSQRHLLCAALSQSALQRGCSRQVLVMATRIGHYDDPVKQSTLASFQRSVRLSFSAK